MATSSGVKFGKTEAGTVWLDPGLTSPYQFYQFWLNADDRDVETYLRLFTFKAQDELAALMREHQGAPGARTPHRALASDLVTRVHGAEALDRVVQAARIIFGELDPQAAPASVWQLLRAEVPSQPLPPGMGPETPIVEILGQCAVVKSRSEARRLIQQRGLSWNGGVVPAADVTAGDALAGGVYWVTIGKKTHFILYHPDSEGR
jgi:tyrosyl-tRNA synthetase